LSADVQVHDPASIGPPLHLRVRSCSAMGCRRVAACLVAVVAAAALTSGGSGAATDADPALARAMQRGGLVLVMRHAATDFSKPDRDRVVLSDCRTQRNLNAQGRADARTIGRGVRRLKLRIGNVFASPFCRTKETARLAFGRFRISQALLNTIETEHDARWRRQIRAARRLLGTKPPTGMLTVLVTHGSVVGDTTGQMLAEGETLVFRPLGSSRFRLLGRILPPEWRTLKPA
jgi:phosphohistidine phosphatase SixA